VTGPALPQSREGNRPGFWYGWVVLGVVFIVLCTLIGTRTSFGVFFKTLSGEFGWNRAQTSGAFSMGMIGFAVSAPFVGWMLDRWSIRWTMALGVLLFGLGMLMGFFVEALWHLYLMNFLLSIGFGAATHVPQVQVLSNWFVRRRGLALGLTSSAQGLAFATGVISAALIAWLGWRETYLVFSGLVLLVTFPLVVIFIRDLPSEKGTVADAPFLGPGEIAVAQEKTPPAGADKPAPTKFPAELIFSFRFALLFGIFGACGFSYTAIVVHLVPLVTDGGFSPSGGAALFTVFGLSVFSGNLSSGISDRIGRTRTYMIGTSLVIGGCLLLASLLGGGTYQLFAGTLIAGYGLGVSRPTIAALLTDHFGGPGFGRVNGTMMMLFAFSGSLGPVTIGYIFDRLGRYREGALLLAAIFLCSCLFAAALEKLKRSGAEGAG
jgi:MFS family permease